MNELHRVVLQKHTPDLVRDLIVTESLLAAMFQKHIFEQEMIELIRACTTPSEKIYKTLDLLPKRGPDAFDRFIEILQEQCDWLAKLLQESLVTEGERLAALKREEVAASLRKEETLVEAAVNSPRVASAATIRLDVDIKTRVSSFVQRQFGNVRRIANTDKKSIERWMGEWLQTERKRLTKLLDEANTEASEQDALEHPDVRERVYALYQYMIIKQGKEPKKKEIDSSVIDNSEENTEVENTEVVMQTREDNITVEDVNFDLLWTEVDELLQAMKQMKQQIDRSFDYIGGKHTGVELSLQVHELCGEFRYQERQLVKERKRIEDMLQELYQYSIMKNKYQNTINHQNNEIVLLQEQLNNQKRDYLELIGEVTALEKERVVHLEKEKTLEGLRTAKDGLQTMLHVVNKQNEELKNMVHSLKAPARPGARGGLQNRKTVVPNKGNTPRVNPKKPVPKRRTSLLHQ